jgi:hypothetical protein
VTSISVDTPDRPACYLYDNTSIVDWAEDYEDGGSKFKERQFPIYCFKGNRLYLCVTSLLICSQLHIWIFSCGEALSGLAIAHKTGLDRSGISGTVEDDAQNK